MNKYQDIFKRYEKKYLLTGAQYPLLLERLQGRAAADQYGKSQICNIYFDTPDYRMIRASLEQPVYKEKLRLRSYGTPNAGSTVFAELKKKYKGVVYKRRVDLPFAAAVNYLYSGRPALSPCQITSEIDWLLAFYGNIIPAMFLAYDRVAMIGTEDPNVRITFDSRILWRQEELVLNAGAWGDPLLKQGQRLMEIKIPGAMPLWLAHILSELKIYPVSYSKYGNAYLASLQAAHAAAKGVDICA